jgi:ABC-type phosphate transport system substrate-binding protein
MSDVQINEFKTKRGTNILHFPTVLGAVVPIYNIPGVTGELNFTPEALAGIFLGKDHQMERSSHRFGQPRREAASRRYRAGAPR